VVVIVIAFVVYSDPEGPVSDTYVSTTEESDQRLADLGLRQSSESNPGILKVSDLRLKAPSKVIADDGNYRADAEVEWIVDIRGPKGFTFTKDKFQEVFDAEWSKNYPSTFYAYFPSVRQWSFAIAADSPEEFDSLELAVELADRFGEFTWSKENMALCLSALKTRLAEFGVSFEVVPREPVEEAFSRAVALRTLQQEAGMEMIIVLRSDSRFKSREFWNTLVDVGLTWGDGDLFHWNNASGIGGDSFFAVWSTTDPGYFLPEEVVDNTFEPEDLVFGFSVPRTADPERVYEKMYDAVVYCQKRLGGVMLNQEGKPVDKAEELRVIQKARARLLVNGFVPGEGAVMRLF
jgi:cell division protein ZipA